MTTRPRRRLIGAVGLLAGLIFVLQLACDIPFFTAPTATSIPTSTQVPTATPLSATQTPFPATPTLPPTPVATLKPMAATATVTQTPKALYQGFITYDQKQETIFGYDFAGAPLDLKIKISGAEYVSLNEAQWANDSIYFVNKKNKTVNQIASGGAAQKINFIPTKNNLHFLISPNGKKIAWSFDSNLGAAPSSELWLANIDGSVLMKIAQIDAANNSKWLVVQPYRWLADGRLLYIDAPTGIGGYIIFYGFAGIHVYDPSNEKTANLTPMMGAGGLCLREISRDLKTVLSSCAGSSQGILSYVNLADDKSLGIVRQADQNQVGSPAYSPSGAWLAYAYARGEVGNELGKIAFLASGSTTPKIIDTVPSGYFNEIGWISENQFLVERYEGDQAVSSVWMYSQDSANGVKLADGILISFIPN